MSKVSEMFSSRDFTLTFVLFLIKSVTKSTKYNWNSARM